MKKARMRKTYCTRCKKYEEFKKPKISYICDKTLLLSSICSACESKDGKIFKEKQSTETLKILCLIKSIITLKL